MQPAERSAGIRLPASGAHSSLVVMGADGVDSMRTEGVPTPTMRADETSETASRGRSYSRGVDNDGRGRTSAR